MDGNLAALELWTPTAAGQRRSWVCDAWRDAWIGIQLKSGNFQGQPQLQMSTAGHAQDVQQGLAGAAEKTASAITKSHMLLRV